MMMINTYSYNLSFSYKIKTIYLKHSLLLFFNFNIKIGNVLVPHWFSIFIYLWSHQVFDRGKLFDRRWYIWSWNCLRFLPMGRHTSHLNYKYKHTHKILLRWEATFALQLHPSLHFNSQRWDMSMERTRRNPRSIIKAASNANPRNWKSILMIAHRNWNYRKECTKIQPWRLTPLSSNRL